jgi:hypothetical protein
MSPDDLSTLGRLAHKKVKLGTLPSKEPSWLSGGPSTATVQTCNLCDRPLAGKTEVEAQFIDATGTVVTRSVRFHTFCFAVWELALRKQRGAA